MKVRIDPGRVSGSVAAPPSKSMTQRVYAAALLHKGKTIIRNAGSSDDELAALEIVRSLGGQVTVGNDKAITITSEGIDITTGMLHYAADTVHCGESGLAVRLFTPIAALNNLPITMTGEGSLLKRSMKSFETVLPQLGVSVKSHNGCMPLQVQGPLMPANMELDGSDSSQYLSGLLFAFAAAGHGLTHSIQVKDLKSTPYIDMTIHVLQLFDNKVTHKHYELFTIEGAMNIDAQDKEIIIDGDWSGAVFLLVAGAIAGSITVSGLSDNRLQADSAILPLLKEIGAIVTAAPDTITVQSAHLRSFEFDATHCPDLFPALAILAACCRGESYIKGVHRLFNKESNRAESISEMLENFDVPFSIEDDALCITGVRNLRGTVIDAHHDHRIAMAAAIGALRASGPVDILHAESVSKSYPGFFNDLILCGGIGNFNLDQ